MKTTDYSKLIVGSFKGWSVLKLNEIEINEIKFENWSNFPLFVKISFNNNYSYLLLIIIIILEQFYLLIKMCLNFRSTIVNKQSLYKFIIKYFAICNRIQKQIPRLFAFSTFYMTIPCSTPMPMQYNLPESAPH